MSALLQVVTLWRVLYDSRWSASGVSFATRLVLTVVYWHPVCFPIALGLALSFLRSLTTLQLSALPVRLDFNYDREPNVEERQKLSRDIYRVDSSQLAEALKLLEARCPRAVIRVSYTVAMTLLASQAEDLAAGIRSS